MHPHTGHGHGQYGHAGRRPLWRMHAAGSVPAPAAAVPPYSLCSPPLPPSRGWRPPPLAHPPAPAPTLAPPRSGLQGKDNLKLSYDLKSENAALEWNRKPFKVVLSSVVSKKPSVGKPTLAATYENVFEF